MGGDTCDGDADGEGVIDNCGLAGCDDGLAGESTRGLLVEIRDALVMDGCNVTIVGDAVSDEGST